MLQKGLLLLLITLIPAGFLFANAPNYSSAKEPMVNREVMDGEAIYYAPELGPPYKPYNSDEPLGDVYVLGETWNDIQHNAGCGRMIQVDSEGWVQAIWMKAFDSGNSSRHIYYQTVDPLGNLGFAGGVQVDQADRGGFCVMELYPDNRAMPAFHQRLPGSPSALFHSCFGFDYIPRSGAFSITDLPWVYEGGFDLKIEWPHMDGAFDASYHIVSTHNPDANPQLGILHPLWYCRAVYDTLLYTVTYMDQYGANRQEPFDTTTVIASEVACSPVSNRVAIAWLEPSATDPADTNQYDNDIYVVISSDGINFDWGNPINVTDFIEPEPGLLPDTLLANKDTLRAYPDICPFFDNNDVLHVIFTTRAYWHFEGTISRGNSFIWHWDEVNQLYSLVANGWFENGFYSPGAWNVYVSRASAGIDSATGDIYCMYQRFFQPEGPSPVYPYPYLAGDTTDFSSSGWPNGEIWMTKSTDNGYSWAEGLNVSRTYSPGALPGDCMSELNPSMAPDVTNGLCHVFYIFDKDAGAATQNEGTWTLNDAVYQAVPIDSIPDSPRLMPYPLHVDSSGMPAGTTAVWSHRPGNLPDNFMLEQNFPNPFNPTTSIEYALQMDGPASLKVYNIQGGEVAVLLDGFQKAGSGQAAFDASDFTSGIYFYRLESQGFTITRKMVLIK